MADYLSYEEVLDELMIDEKELQRLISQGELRGFRDGMTMKFKRSDVMKLKQGRNTEPTIILTSSDNDLDIPESSDELLIEDSGVDDTVLSISDDFMDSTDSLGSGDELSLSSSSDNIILSSADSEEAIPTLEAPSVSGEESATLEFYDSSSDDTGALMDVAASSEYGGTEALELVDEESGETGALALESGEWEEESGEVASVVEEEASSVGEAGVPRSTVSTRAARSSRRAVATSAVLQKSPTSIGWTITLLLSVLIMFIPLLLLFNIMRGTEADWAQSLAGMFNGLTEFFYKTFAK